MSHHSIICGVLFFLAMLTLLIALFRPHASPKDLSQPVAKDHNHNQSLLDARRVDEFGQNKSALVGLVASTTDGAIVEANGGQELGPVRRMISQPATPPDSESTPPQSSMLKGVSRASI